MRVIEQYDLEKHTESIFANIFEGFSMPSYSNYPYPYRFNNDKEQFQMAGSIRKKVDEIKSKDPAENFMYYVNEANGLSISVCRDGQTTSHKLKEKEGEIYLSAIDESQRLSRVCEEYSVSEDALRSILNDFESKGLILYSSGKRSFLSLAMKGDH